MTKEELIHLQDHATHQAGQFAMKATVTYDDSDGSIAVTVITRAGGGPPRSVRRSAKFTDRARAEAVQHHRGMTMCSSARKATASSTFTVGIPSSWT